MGFKVHVVGEGSFLVDEETVATQTGAKLVLSGGTVDWRSFKSDWKQWWHRLPSLRPDEHLIRCSPRVARVKSSLDEAMPGLLFVDITRFQTVIRVRQVLLEGGHFQPLADRGSYSWSLFTTESNEHGSQVVSHICQQLKSLIRPNDLGRYLEVGEILNQQPFSLWGFAENTQWIYDHMAQTGSLGWDEPAPTTQALLKGVRQLMTIREAMRCGEDRGEELGTILDSLHKRIGTPYLFDLRKVSLPSEGDFAVGLP